ncbi:MAG: hypothetical protein K6F36_04425 [Bacilli bacterium]|nr:hypothetical protein [Bacilli bacterium]
MGLDKRMKKRIQQIDKNLDAIVKNPYEKKEIIEKKPKSFPSWTRWALPLGGALLTCSLALGVVLPISLMGKGGMKGVAGAAAEASSSMGKNGPQGSAVAAVSDKTPTKGNPKSYDEYQEGSYVHEDLNRLITPTHQQTKGGINGMSLTTYNSYKAFAKKFVTLMMDVNNPAGSSEESLAISIPDAYIALAITGIISDQNGLQEILDYVELDNAAALKTATKEIVANLGTITKDHAGNDVGGLNLNSIWLNPDKVRLLQETDTELYSDLQDAFDASLYMEALTSNKAMQYIAENGLPGRPVPNIQLPDDNHPAAINIMSVFYDIDSFENQDYYESQYLSGTHLMNYTCNGQTKRVDYIKQSEEHSYLYEGDNLTGATMSLEHSNMTFFLPKNETAMPSSILQDVLDNNYSPKTVTYERNGEERTADTYEVNISAPYFLLDNASELQQDDLISDFPHLTQIGGFGSRLAESTKGLPIGLSYIAQFSTMRFDYQGFYSCSATIVGGDEMASGDETSVDFVVNRPYVFERSKYLPVGDSHLNVPIIVGEVIDPNYRV